MTHVANDNVLKVGLTEQQRGHVIEATEDDEGRGMRHVEQGHDGGPERGQVPGRLTAHIRHQARYVCDESTTHNHFFTFYCLLIHY